jgi:hypothetical protein
MFSNFHLSVFQTKPFTPILGETSQLRIGDMDIYLENTVSKPPTINFYGIAKNYKIYGNIALYAETGANSVTAKKRGKYVVEFNDYDSTTNEIKKDCYKLYIPTIYINGILFGKRTYNIISPMVVESLNNNMSLFVKFNPDKRGSVANILGLSQKSFPDYAKGFIVNSKLVNLDLKNLEHKSKPSPKEIICDVDGEWTNYIRFENKTKYWSKEEHKLPVLSKQKTSEDKNSSFVIPSDSSFRLDIQAFKRDDKDEAQKWKEQYEQTQRDDRSLRKKYSTK